MELDPYPWREGDRRLGYESGGSGAIPVVFDPRPEYEQDRALYAQSASWGKLTPLERSRFLRAMNFGVNGGRPFSDDPSLTSRPPEVFDPEHARELVSVEIEYGIDAREEIEDEDY